MKFGFLKFGFYKFMAAALLAIGLMASDGFAQNLDIFSGHGIPDFQPQQRQATPDYDKFLKDGAASSAARKPFSGLFKKPKLPSWDGLKQKPLAETSDRPNPFSDLLPRRDTSRPNFFEKIKGWAKGKGADAKEKSNATWNNVLRDFKANEAELRKAENLPAQPSFRTAESIGEPKLRF